MGLGTVATAAPPVSTGIALALYAGDVLYDFEIQRAPDVAGAPGAWTTIAANMPGVTEIFVDRLPTDGVTRWYQIRHTGLGDTPSLFAGPVSAIPCVIPPALTRPPIGPPLSLYIVRSAAAGGHITLDAYVADPFPSNGVPIKLSAKFDGVPAVVPTDVTLTAPADPITADLTTTDFAQFVVTQPPAASPQGRVSIIATRQGRRDAVQSVDVAPREAFGLPAPTIGPAEAEGTGEGGNAEGVIHIPIVFDRNTAEIRFFASESRLPGIAIPGQSANETSGILTRQEGIVESSDTWATMWDISTTPGSYRRYVALAVGPTGLKADPVSEELQAVDTGTGPTAGPSSVTVVMSTVSGFARATVTFVIVDALAEHRIHRNGVIVVLLAAGVSTFVDDGLAPGKDYLYEVDAYRNGQSSGKPTSGIDPSGTPTLVAPTWVFGYPYGDLSGPTPDAVIYFFINNPDPLARTQIYSNASSSDGPGPFPTLICDLDPGDQYFVGSGPGAGTVRWFYAISSRVGYVDSVESAHASATYGG